MSSVLKWLLSRFPYYSNALLASVFKISQENLQMKFLVNKKNRVVFLLSANRVILVIKNEVQMNSAVLKRTWLFSLTTSIIPRVALTYPDTRIQPNTKPCISTEKEICRCFSSCFANWCLTQTARRDEYVVWMKNLLWNRETVHQAIKIFLYLGTSVSLKNVWSCESLSVPYSMRVWRAKSEILSMGVCMRDTVRWAARLAVYVALMIITANQKTDTVTLPDHDLGCSAPCRTYAFHDDQTELLKLRVSASLITSGLSWRGSKWKQRLYSE